VGVVVFPGSCDEADAVGAVARIPGLEGEYLWHGDADLRGVDAVVIPGGFSYGDYLRAGAIARFSPVMSAIDEFARAGGPVLGICNGFQVLCEAGLLPGALLPNAGLRFVCRQVGLTVERTDTAWTAAFGQDESISIPVKHSVGRYFAPPEQLAALDAAGQVALRYRRGENPNGSVADIAGVVNAQRNVLGLMPHPEHAADPLGGSQDGARIIGSVLRRLATVAA
jgi:phosphoribosylformylglycinamidine synthase